MALTRREFLAGAALAGTGLGPGWPQLAEAHAVLVESPVACGRFFGFDGSASQKRPDVLALVRVAGDEILYAGQPLGLVVATRPESALAAARDCVLLRESQPAVLATAAALIDAHAPSPAAAPFPLSTDDLASERGDVERALLKAQPRPLGCLLRQTYHTAPEPLPEELLEPAAAAARERLTALAAQAVGRPVRLALSSAQCQTLAGHRPETIQTLTLSADRSGRLRALVHGSLNETAMTAEYVEPCGLVSRHLYAVDNLRVVHKIARKNVAPRGAPLLPAAGLLPGLFALESLLDELSAFLRIDPVRLRLINHAETDAATGRPWNGKRLRECYRLGAERIGWAARRLEPPASHEGLRSDGLGVASAMGLPRLAENGTIDAPFGAHFTQVVADLEHPPGSLRIARHIAVLDVGSLPDAKKAQAAAQAEVALALAGALRRGTKRLAPPAVEVIFLEPESSSSAKEIEPQPPLGPAALRDLAMSGVAASLASALYNATGMRHRELPIRLDQMIL